MFTGPDTACGTTGNAACRCGNTDDGQSVCYNVAGFACSTDSRPCTRSKDCSAGMVCIINANCFEQAAACGYLVDPDCDTPTTASTTTQSTATQTTTTQTPTSTFVNAMCAGTNKECSVNLPPSCGALPSCFCATTAEGSPICYNLFGRGCDAISPQPCIHSSDCNELGYVCAVNTCCGSTSDCPTQSYCLPAIDHDCVAS